MDGEQTRPLKAVILKTNAFCVATKKPPVDRQGYKVVSFNLSRSSNSLLGHHPVSAHLLRILRLLLL